MIDDFMQPAIYYRPRRVTKYVGCQVAASERTTSPLDFKHFSAKPIAKSAAAGKRASSWFH
jgi:hypothetical protein